MAVSTIIANLVLTEDGYNSERGTTRWNLDMVVNGVPHTLMQTDVKTSRDDEQEAAERFAQRIKDVLTPHGGR